LTPPAPLGADRASLLIIAVAHLRTGRARIERSATGPAAPSGGDDDPGADEQQDRSAERDLTGR